MLAIATPEMINPVADQCEANGVPCLSTLAPWQPYFFGRGGDPAKGSTGRTTSSGAPISWSVCSATCGASSTPTRPSVCCAPTIPTATRWPIAKTGFPAGAAAAGYKLVDPGRFQTLSDDFSSVIGQFKDGGVEIVVGIPIPPDFATFWTQAKQQGFNPKLVTMAKAVLFSSAVEALGDIGDGLASEVWWTPNHPFSSSLTGETSKQVWATTYETSTGKQWTQFVGFVHALFEVCFDVLARAGSTDKQAIADAAGATELDTIVGPIAYGANGAAEEHQPDLAGRRAVEEDRWRQVPVRPASSPTTRCRRRSRPMANSTPLA